MTQWGLDVLFNPAKRHMDEEKRRLQSTREEIGDSSGGKRIDFDSGKVVIERRADDDDDAERTTLDRRRATPSARLVDRGRPRTDDASTKINGKINKKTGKSSPPPPRRRPPSAAPNVTVGHGLSAALAARPVTEPVQDQLRDGCRLSRA